MSARFIDTNVLVYAFSGDPRSARAEELLAGRCAVSVQVLNEFVHVARRKLGFAWSELHAALDAVRTLCPLVVPLDLAVHEQAVRVAERHGFSFYDALIVSAALTARCDVLYTEDLNHGQVIDGRLRVENPF